jgi:protein FrlC
MKLGTATSVLYQYSLVDAIPLIARTGFDGVDIWGGRPHVYRQDYTQEELKGLRKLIADHGLVVSSFMPAFYRYPHSLSNPNQRIRQDSIEYMRICIENAAVLGSKIVLVVPDHSLYGQSRYDSLQRMIDSLTSIAPHAVNHDLILGIEVLYYDETDLVNNSADALSIIQTVGGSHFGVVADTGTLNLSKENASQMMQMLGSLLLQIHVNDNHGDKKQENLIPGDGTFDFAGLIRTLNEFKYAGFLSAELSKEYSDHAEVALKKTAERMRAWMVS